jgi:hypothetical protein
VLQTNLRAPLKFDHRISQEVQICRRKIFLTKNSEDTNTLVSIHNRIAVVEECPKGQMRVEDNCVKIAPDPTCQPGQMMVQGNCVPIANPNSKCPQGQLYVDGKCVPIPSQKQQQPVLCPTASTSSSLLDSGRLVFVADTTGTPQGSTGGSSSKPADPSSNCPTGTNQPTTPQSLTSPSTPSSPTTTPSQSAATPPPSDGTTTTTPSPQGTITQPAPPSTGGQPSAAAGNSGGEGGQVQKKYEPPAAALPYRGNEIELIEFYAQPVPDPDAIVRIDKVGEDTIVTFADGTIKSSKVVPKDIMARGEGEGKAAYIIPGTNTPLDRLGVDRVDIPDPTSRNFAPEASAVDGPVISYKDGSKIGRSFQSDSWIFDASIATEFIKHTDSKGKEVESIYVDNSDKTTMVSKPDGSDSRYNADGSYITAWPKQADGSQQFYDSKQQKLFVRDSNGNIIPPRE